MKILFALLGIPALALLAREIMRSLAETHHRNEVETALCEPLPKSWRAPEEEEP